MQPILSSMEYFALTICCICVGLSRTDTLEASLDNNIRTTFNCQKRNANVRFDAPSDIAFL